MSVDSHHSEPVINRRFLLRYPTEEFQLLGAGEARLVLHFFECLIPWNIPEFPIPSHGTKLPFPNDEIDFRV